MLTMEGSSKRQEDFRRAVEQQGLAGAYISNPSDIYALTGLLLNPDEASGEFPALLWVGADGSSWLAAHRDDGEAVVGDRLSYEWHVMFTMNPDPLRRLNDVVTAQVAGGQQPNRVGYQAESMPHLLADSIGRVQRPSEWQPVDDLLARHRMVKEPDEVELLRRAAACTLAAYDAAQAAIAPGVSELSVKEAGHRAATMEAGEVMFHNGDYQSGEFGGFARNRPIEAGELYVIDGWSRFQGYWSDLCRTFPVSEATPLQAEVHAHVADTLRGVEERLKPGLHTSDLWHWIDQQLREHPHLRESGLTHHGGHGIGLRAHEAPDINRDRGGELRAGYVVSVEPGGYSPELNAGIRLENTFLITDTGCENLSDYPLDLPS